MLDDHKIKINLLSSRQDVMVRIQNQDGTTILLFL